MEEEITFHVEERARELIAQGQDPASARASALREFGDVREARAELEAIGHRRVRQERRADWWSDLRQDVRYGVRFLWHAPLFSLLAIVTLALGIGANAAAFGVMKSVLLDALPYADADRLVRLYGRLLDGSQERGPLSAATVGDIAGRQQSFERVSAFVNFRADALFGSDAGARATKVGWVEPGFFDTLGVPAGQGRTFGRGDAVSGFVPFSGGTRGPDTASAALVTYGAWQRLFAGDPGVLGRQVHLNGLPRTVIGVLPRGFVGPMGEVDFFLAFDPAPVIADPVAGRRSQWLAAVGRLKPGVTHEAARRELAAIGADLAREHPRDNGSFGLLAMPLRDALVGDTRRPLLVLVASAALVLLIACANLAGALLARTLSRRGEFAVRVALGAGRGRLVRQVLTESLVLAAVGGAAGLLLARFVLSLLEGLSLDVLPAYADLSLDVEAMLLTAALTLSTGLVFGAAPALSVNHANAHDTLRGSGRGAGESRRSHRLRGALVAGQIALCVSLLAGAGLLARSLWAMANAPLGFEAAGVLAATVQLPARDYATPEARIRFLEQFTERLRTLPGVDLVADASSAPTAVGTRMSFSVDGAPPAADDAEPFVPYAVVSGEYFRALRVPLRQGRTFDAQDRVGAPPTVIISESMARRYWPRGEALHARLRIGPNPTSPLMEVVGIVGDVRNDLSSREAQPMIYGSSRQAPFPGATFLLRTAGDPPALVRPVERALAGLDGRLAFQQTITTMGAVVGEGLAGRRYPVFLMTAFGALALLLASIGIYAMFASAAAAREREFGVRMALGSRPLAIAGLVLRQGAAWMAAGLVGGALGILLVVRLLRDLLYEVSPFDPVALGIAVAILMGSATIALLIPLRRAMRVDPAGALRAL